MTWKQFFTSSIGKKFIMGLTGLFLISFLVVHCTINSMIFFNDGGEMFNTYAHFMSHNYIIRVIEVGLFAGLLAHIIQGLMLMKQNSAARPVGYAANAAGKNSKWYSRSMGLLGTLLLFFLVLHISKFFVNTKIALYSGDQPHNTFEEMKEYFQQLWVVVAYIAGVVSLFWHLLHGFPSAFQTLGINHKRYTPIIQAAGTAFSVIVCLLFALMPLSFYLGWIN
ncbi:MAG TPA: succinate dehydrogenase cytochrome b subunit [Ferruginibacter sp.]|jgi:succinate dehydrogenase / fumarate reductase cytochrome b subunit|nr:succinate dehydrogenase cytochrome b subunit [Ferruginibacter sp.]MBN8700998.1 succinate dehydrogenase cytochrome b subunit [Chitinophagales bacterium]TXH29794.1 MAG: succinate dehydrogenase cytochrome b subunit [Cyclobacteriaceae bacterium]HMU73164.1 succinate dehydrogenase cytochrome b subunit [Ferruginibacter sp.]HMX37142.1 succinate dehydrogenase cytochrome b subunit [Ferruginibacter sp.]